MKKSEIAMQFERTAASHFVLSAAALVANALFTNLLTLLELPQIFHYIVQFFAVVFFVFAYVMTIKGFCTVNKACKLSEENENFYVGKNLTVLSVLSFVLTVLFELAALFLYMLVYQYASADSLTQADLQAANNLRIITSLVLIAVQLVSISLPYIFYLWKIHKNTPKTDSINNFALLAMIVLLVQLAIGVLNSLYTIKGSSSSFLSGFSGVLMTVKYVILLLFFITRKKNLLTAEAQTAADASDSAEAEQE